MKLKVNQTVDCPSDMGQPAYQGVVVSFSDTLHKNCKGVEYQWVTVRHPRGSNHVWPSNRLR